MCVSRAASFDGTITINSVMSFLYSCHLVFCQFSYNVGEKRKRMLMKAKKKKEICYQLLVDIALFSACGIFLSEHISNKQWTHLFNECNINSLYVLRLPQKRIKKHINIYLNLIETCLSTSLMYFFLDIINVLRPNIWFNNKKEKYEPF